MILYEQYCGGERNDFRTKIFKNEEDMLSYMQDNKGYLLGEPLSHRHYKIIITQLGGEKQ